MRTDTSYSPRRTPLLKRLRPQDYSGLVRRLRVVLPVIAVFLVAGVVIWPHFDPAQAPKKHVEAKAPEMHNSKYTGVDSGNQPYTITADRTIQTTNGSNDIDLIKPKADIRLKNGAWVLVSGETGQYREQSGLITMEGDVQLYHDSGYEVRTAAAAIDLDKGIAYSDLPTQAIGPRGEIEGQGFRLYQDSDRVVFTGKSRLLLKPPEDVVAPAGGGGGGYAMKMRPDFVALLAALCIAPAMAESPASTPDTGLVPASQAPQPGPSNTTGPNALPLDALEVTATGTLEWLKGEQMYVARQNAVARRNDTTVKADELVAHYRVPAGKTSGSEISQVTAEGNPVQVLSPTAIAYGQHGLYDLDKHVVILTGDNLKLITTDDVITARDSMEYFEDTGIGVARGNAVAIQGDDKLTADTIAAKFAKKAAPDDGKDSPQPAPASKTTPADATPAADKPKSGLERLDAKGHVVLVTPTEVITGDEGVYNPQLDQATVLGNVHVTKEKNQLDGARAEVDLATGVSRVYPATDARVRGLFVPKKKGEADKPAQDNG